MPNDEMTDLPVRDQFSAGGVALRDDDGVLKVAIVLMLPELRWQLPKGIIDPGETAAEAALREVREEAGIDCELLAPIRRIEYWFNTSRDGEAIRVHKFVKFFLMRYISGHVSDHDYEVAEASWVSVKDALEMLVFESEREVVSEGLKIHRDSSDSAVPTTDYA
ncbi:hypothetical protein BH24ACI3_BH24ACI3_13660 [soil metagenome]